MFVDYHDDNVCTTKNVYRNREEDIDVDVLMYRNVCIYLYRCMYDAL